MLVSVNRVTCSLLYRCFGSLTCQIVCLSARTYQTDRGFLPTSRPPYYMVAHGVRARGRYLIVCAESDYSTCDRPPSVAHVGVVGATISGWFGLVNPYRLWLLSHSLVSLGLRWCPQPLMLLCPYSTMVMGDAVNLSYCDLSHIIWGWGESPAMWAAGMFLLSAWRTVRDLTPTLIRFHWVSVRVRTSGFRVGVLVACARACGRLYLWFMGVCWWLLPAGRSSHTGLRPLRRSWCSYWLSC